MGAVLSIQSLFEGPVEFRIVEVPPDIAHLREKVLPVGFIEFDRVGLLGSEGSDRLIQAFAESFIGQILTIHPDQGELIGQKPRAD